MAKRHCFSDTLENSTPVGGFSVRLQIRTETVGPGSVEFDRLVRNSAWCKFAKHQFSPVCSAVPF